MRTSQKALLTALIILTISLLGIIFCARLLFFEKVDSPEVPLATEILEVADFNSVVIDGNMWNIEIQQDSTYGGEITFPENKRNNFEYSVRDNEFYLSGPQKINGFQFNKKIKNQSVEGEISGKMNGYAKLKNKKDKNDYKLSINVPSLERIQLDGLGNLLITGFDEKSIKFVVDGTMSVTAEDCSADDLEVISDSIGSIDLGGLAAVNAMVDLSGVGSMDLNMNGGILSGKLSGIGSIRYTGNVTREDIEVDGLGSVEYDG